MARHILVWDLPTRFFHWALALSFAGAYLTAESERWASIHLLLGYTLLLLLAFRLLWGIVGTRYARFANFLYRPQAVIGYLQSLLRGRPEPSIGHNPAGSVVIILLILLGVATGISGWAVCQESGGEWAEELHEITASVMLAVVGLHILGVIVSSKLHHENLVLAMITGKKKGTSPDAISTGKPWIALLLAAAIAGFWAWSFANPDQLRSLGGDFCLEAGKGGQELDDDD